MSGEQERFYNRQYKNLQNDPNQQQNTQQLQCQVCGQNQPNTLRYYPEIGYTVCDSCITKLSSSMPDPQSKPMEKEPKAFSLPAEFIKHFFDENGLDEEAIHGFLDSLDENQLRIIKNKNNDCNVLLKIKSEIESDISNTAKQLAME